MKKCSNFFFPVVLAPLHPPPGARPPGPESFQVEDYHGNRFALSGISAKNLNIFFFLRVKTFFFLNRLNRTKNKFHRNRTKKKFWSHFSLFSHFKSTISHFFLTFSFLTKLFFTNFFLFNNCVKLYKLFFQILLTV